MSKQEDSGLNSRVAIWQFLFVWRIYYLENLICANE